MRWKLLLLCLLTACAESEDTRKHRFLLKGNAALEEQNEEQAIQYFEEALRIDSCFADAHNNIGTVLFRQQKYAEALDSYNHSIACKTDFLNAYFNRSNTLYELGKSEEALIDIEKVLLKKADTIPALFLRGLIYTRMRDYKKAQDSFLGAFLRDSLNVEILINLGTVSYYQKNYSISNAYLHKAISLNPKEANAFNARSLVEIANGDLAAAIKSINSAIILKPGNAFYRNNRGYIYLLNNELALALADIDYSIATDPYNAWAYRNKGIYYLKMGEGISSIRLLTQAIELEPHVELGYYYLAKAFFATGDSNKGCESWRESLNRKEIDGKDYDLLCPN